jgi:hypothetical protein
VRLILSSMVSIEGLVRSLNDQARSTLLEDGSHSLMFFLRMPSGEVRPSLLAVTSRADMPAGFQRIADEGRSSGADGVVVIAEAWRAKVSEVPEGRGPWDAAESEDVLMVAGPDREGNELALQTPLYRRGWLKKKVTLGESNEDGPQMPFLDRVREVWGLPPAAS